MKGLRLAAFGVVCACAVGLAQDAKGPASPAAPAQQADVKASGPIQGHALEAGDLEGFFDGIVPLQLERSDIAGATVLVMQGDTVLLKKGYGVADEKKQTPVDPATTIFRLASISKLFTWTSVMQLEEQGKLDLDTDVNKYLDFEIHPKFGKPITLRNLMTHSGGFEEEDRDVIMTDPKKVPTLRAFLIRNQPDRLFAPGTETAYSNYGVGLAGYIVQRVSGEPYEQYVAEHIFQPLGMTHSTFYQPPQKGLPATPSDGYRSNTTKPPVGFEIFNPAPAGGISSTAQDMGRFAQMLLHGGSLDGKQILKPETLKQMWTPQFQASKLLAPICMGFYESWRNGVRWIGHQGDLIAFHSMFFVDPVSKTTIFVSYNSAGSADKPRPELLDMFTDRYFPGYVTPPFISESRAELKQIEGTYETTRRADSNRTRLGYLAGQSTATIDKDGALHFGDARDLRGHPVKWKPIAKDTWQEVDGQRRLFAIRDGDGKIVRIASIFAGAQMERVKWYTNGTVMGPLIFLSLAVLGLVIAAPLWRLGRRMFLRHRAKPQPQPGTSWLPVMTKISAAAWVVPLLAVLVWGSTLGADTMPPQDSWDKWFVLMNLVIGLAILLSVFPVISGLRVWSKADLRGITKVKYSLVGLSCVMLCWVAIVFHLIGPLRV